MVEILCIFCIGDVQFLRVVQGLRERAHSVCRFFRILSGEEILPLYQAVWPSGDNGDMGDAAIPDSSRHKFCRFVLNKELEDVKSLSKNS